MILGFPARRPECNSPLGRTLSDVDTLGEVPEVGNHARMVTPLATGYPTYKTHTRRVLRLRLQIPDFHTTVPLQLSAKLYIFRQLLLHFRRLPQECCKPARNVIPRNVSEVDLRFTKIGLQFNVSQGRGQRLS